MMQIERVVLVSTNAPNNDECKKVRKIDIAAQLLSTLVWSKREFWDTKSGKTDFAK